MSRTLISLIVGALLGAVVGGLMVYMIRGQAIHADEAFCLQPLHHCIVVTANNSQPPAISVNTDPLGKHGRGHIIRWIISNPTSHDFKFTSKGIVFPQGSGFGCRPDPGDAHIFECADPVGNVGDYKYDVTVAEGSNPPLHLDPHIINN